ncbi:MAG: hypothetical protein LLG04_14435 [Parachlamydia sp.]|nr:hypothetical protein [Parachlamydia sp.]
MTTSYLYLPPQLMQNMLPLDAKGCYKEYDGRSRGGMRSVNRARYDKSNFGDGQNEKRTPEEHCFFWIDKLQRNPNPHEHADEAAKRKKQIQEIEETAKLLKAHAKSLQDSQKNDAKKISPLLANEKVFTELLRKPLQERKDMLLRNLADDQGFRPESLLLFRSIKYQLASQPTQENSLFIQKLQGSYKLPKEFSAQRPALHGLALHRLALKYDLPMTAQKIRERWLYSDDHRHLE